ncbi:MAG: hypothetical protein RTU30_01755 [Candidatus Thorarchaeota archaeon]
MDTKKLLALLCKQVENKEVLPWLDEYLIPDLPFNFRPFKPPKGEVLTQRIGQ